MLGFLWLSWNLEIIRDGSDDVGFYSFHKFFPVVGGIVLEAEVEMGSRGRDWHADKEIII